MHKLEKALKRIRNMPEARYIRLKNIFVSVDPDRDKNQRIKRFLELFDNEFLGVTG